MASLELAKGAVVLLLGFGAVSLVHKDAWDVAESLLQILHVNPDHHRYAQVFLNLADNVTDAKLWAMAAGAMAYSIIRFVEAYGLWRARTWAEWFALISGAIYVPFEAYEVGAPGNSSSRRGAARQSRNRFLHAVSEGLSPQGSHSVRTVGMKISR